MEEHNDHMQHGACLLFHHKVLDILMFLCVALLWCSLVFFPPCVALNITLKCGVECKIT